MTNINSSLNSEMNSPRQISGQENSGQASGQASGHSLESGIVDPRSEINPDIQMGAGVPEVNPASNPELVPEITEDPSSDNTARPPGDWTVAPDPIEPGKDGQQIEDPRVRRFEDTGT